jgi:uncharacterized membrane protein
MAKKTRAKGGVLATVGYVLSPLSFWNDLFVNIPIAYAFGVLFGLISESLFFPFMIIGYWISNVLGFVLLHMGVSDVVKGTEKKYTRKDVIRDIVISLAYTLIIVALVVSGILQFPTEYLKYFQ